MRTSRPPIGLKSSPAPAVSPDKAAAPAHSSQLLRVSAPSYLVSTAIHFVAILVMACMYVDLPQQVRAALIEAKVDVEREPLDELREDTIPLPIETTQVSNTRSDVISELARENVIDIPTDMSPVDDTDPGEISVEVEKFGQETAPSKDLYKPATGLTPGTGLGHRTGSTQAKMITGATTETEKAVAAALKWLADHQLPDGGWSFDHRGGACNGRCGNAGDLKDCRTGATAMALLPFLGAGQTHKTGKYKKNVEAGLYFLVSQMKVQANRGDLAQGGGNLYSHGLGAIVLTEAHAMTQDKSLMAPAQYSLNHIVFAQDPLGGGWRYQPKQPGDTSVVGWQLMALKSGHMAYLNVPKETIVNATKFLDSVQSESGAKYGYTDSGAGSATTAVGLLCRMYLGWKKDHPGIERGTDYLSQAGPSKNNMYFNYYATQVLRHYDGEKWDKWNKVMRDQLVDTQEKNGHLEGSWYQGGGGDHGMSHGGRLYCTSMSCMILEVYYRHLPIYGTEAAADDFPL